MRRKPGWTWWLVRVAASLAPAAITTWSVAWACAAWDQRTKGAFYEGSASTAWWWKNSRSAHYPVPGMGLFGSLIGSTRTRATYGKPGTSLVVQEGTFSPTSRWTFGWPRPCLGLTKADFVRVPFEGEEDARVWGLRIEREGQPDLRLPIDVIAPGLAVNLAAWSLAFATPLLFVPLLRRLRRARRGWCLACGYDRSTIPAPAPCPECGFERSGR